MKTLMKMCVLSIAVTGILHATGITTYYWVGGAGTVAWADGSTWNTTKGGGGTFRTTPLSTDVLIIDGTDLGSGATGALTITGVATQTVGELILTGNATATLQASAASTVLTIGGGAGALDVASGCNFNASGSNTLTINVATGATGSISGTMNLAGAAHKLTAADASGITFQNGSTFSQGTGFTGNPFGTTSYNSVVFANGSTYVFSLGSNPFGASAPNSVVVFQSGSLYTHQGSGTPSFSGRSYADFELKYSATFTTTGSSAVTMNNVTITTGTLNFNVTGTPGHSIKGNISVASGQTLNFSPSSAGAVNLNGSSLQTISGSGTISTGANSTIVVNNSNGIALGMNATIGGTLMLTSGKVTLGANNLTVKTVSGGSSTSYVDASSTGEYRQSVAATGAFTMSVGDASNYTPASINVTAGSFSSAYVGASLTASKYTNNSSSTDYINRYWTITTNGITGPSYDATFTYVPADVAGTEGNLYGGAYSSSWTLLGAVNTGTHSFSGSGLTSSPVVFTAGEQAALPVEMISLKAESKHLGADLHWSTATETNNFGFEIERKTLSADWAKVGFIAGAGTSTSLHNYAYTDEVGEAGTYQYRIKQIDKNGSFKYSTVMQVEVGAVAKVLSLGSNYPNPFNPTTSVEFSVPTDGRATLKVYNILGQEVATLFDGVATAGRLLKASFNASRLSSGVYFSRLDFGGNALVKRMMLVK